MRACCIAQNKGKGNCTEKSSVFQSDSFVTKTEPHIISYRFTFGHSQPSRAHTLQAKNISPKLFQNSLTVTNTQFLSKTKTKTQIAMSTLKIQPTAFALSSSVRQLGFFNLNLPRNCVASSNHFSRYGTRRALTVSMSTTSSNPLEVCVKSSTTTPNKPGDCK